MSNAYDAQTSWSTRNGIPGPLMLQDTPAARESDASNSSTGQIRAGYSSPTPATNSSNASNSGGGGSGSGGSGGGRLPHDFATLGRDITIATGVYYHLIPKQAGGSTHIDMKDYWFPVTGDAPVDFTFSHQWDQADNLAKKMLGAIGSAGDALTGPLSSLGLGSLAVNQAQHLYGGLYFSGCSVFNSSAPPTIAVSTKLFSVGGNNLISIIETLRGDTHARLGGGLKALAAGAASLAGRVSSAAGDAINSGASSVSSLAGQAGLKGGKLDHPGWWDVEVVSFAGESGGAQTVAKMKDMICTGLKVTMYSPWVGIEPSYIELRIDFQHAYPGLAESMSFGG